MQKDHSAHRPSSQHYPLCYLAIDIRTPTNVGGLFRIADALAIEKIYLAGNSLTPPNSKLRKISRSTEKHVAYAYKENALETARHLKSLGYRLVCLEITSSSIELDQLSVGAQDRICLVLGSEKDGIPHELLALADATVHIPMYGTNSSMNVAAACAIATYDITGKLRRAGVQL
ncbi:TrmH family RNA methyltransferase [Microbulbifer marinus]|uniref:SpoU rRNA Methylase family protein n=1 Tax=Microbulbifer marinus TaxID=658218 RepID=A0A1H3WY63_9GAMM|nr:TrmH family RNA methyltransferase [Microbulbifer marinus]SDZ91681.1 SpoU rRNA Methylase family protein [Microbulbifer marinus]